MKSPYKPEVIKAAMTLKSLSTIAIAKQMNISRRSLDYFINGTTKMNRGEEFLQILQPELSEICKIDKKIKRRRLQHCEVS
ncbi:MAG: hypothetical protein K8S23_02640 [Candidatus Cloacimonetes bacterium]|nr:hypothetical protein [Candidatus Cloacimonadota bacterium]